MFPGETRDQLDRRRVRRGSVGRRQIKLGASVDAFSPQIRKRMTAGERRLTPAGDGDVRRGEPLEHPEDHVDAVGAVRLAGPGNRDRDEIDSRRAEQERERHQVVRGDVGVEQHRSPSCRSGTGGRGRRQRAGRRRRRCRRHLGWRARGAATEHQADEQQAKPHAGRSQIHRSSLSNLPPIGLDLFSVHPGGNGACLRGRAASLGGDRRTTMDHAYCAVSLGCASRMSSSPRIDFSSVTVPP